jgi:hypothetical protein
MHNLHDPNLYSTRYGTVLRCECCDRMQVTFHGYVLLMDEAEFERLQTAVERAYEQGAADADQAPDVDRATSGNQDGWGIQADTDGGTVKVRLTETSLAALHALLQGAWQMYVLDERLRAAASGLAERAPDVVRDHAPGAG